MDSLKREFISFPVADPQRIKMQMLNWANRFNICCFLDNHNYGGSYHSVECIVAAGAVATYSSIKSLPADKWLFGHLGYDLKNEFEELSSENRDYIQFPDVCFFEPEYVIQLSSTELRIGSLKKDHEEVFRSTLSLAAVDVKLSHGASLDHRETEGGIKTRFTKESYIATVQKIRQHILRGDCYELNLCQEFYIEDIDINPLELYSALSASSPNPFSAYYKLNDKYAVCLSPERYLKKQNTHLLSQPIKGTAQRSGDPQQDLINLDKLKNSEKERAENIMVVDLVRNDLSRICKKGTVKVDELCAIYSFPQVHQMISTVSGEISNEINFAEIIKATFPMGSMTGAPKKRVMELIEKYELSKRGLFSGSIGYIDPTNNFDFNVVIRSVFYNSTNNYLSFHTGSAITYNSDAEKEYEECLLKASAIKKALAETNTFH